jgi:hypothetical protein
MDSENVDNGETQNPVENDVGIANNSSLQDRLKSVLFSDEQDNGNPEPDAEEGEAQTEDKAFDGSETDSETEVADTEDPQAEDGTEVLSQDEEKAEPTEQEQSGFRKRIDKLTALRKQAEEKVDTLTEELETYKSKVNELEAARTRPQPTEDNPFSDLDSEAKINSEYEQARKIKYKCEESPDGFQIGDTYFDSTQVRAMRVNAMKAMEIQLPKQLEFVKAKNHWSPLAHKTYPWMSQKESQEYKLAQQVIKNFPTFVNHPDYEMFVGDYVRGYMARTAKSVAKSAKTVPSMSVKPTSSATQSSKVNAAARNVEQRYLRTGSREDLKKAVFKFL